MIYRDMELYNVVETEDTGDGIRMSRIPELLRNQLNEGAQRRAYNLCGCELRFNLISDSARFVFRKEGGDSVSPYGMAEVYYGSFQGPYMVSPQMIGKSRSEVIVHRPSPAKLAELTAIAQANGLPFDPNLIRIILPYDWEIQLLEADGEFQPPRPEQSPGMRYLAYGSSITHGGDAMRPSGSYAMRTAQSLKADLISMGFAGSAHMEPAMADYITSREWDFATLEMGINVIGQWSAEQFQERIDYFIPAIARSNPDKWVFCIDLFRFDMDFKEDPKAEVFRSIIKRKVEELNLPKLVYVCGTELLVSADGLSADLIHPSAHGQEEIARRLSALIRSKLEG
jgi:lysophospholipase L1-like esterase